MNVKYIFILLTACVLWSCESMDTPLIDRESDLTYWDKPEDALYALNRCYPDLYDAEQFIFTESLSDNAYTKNNSGLLVRDVANGSYDASAGLIKGVWDSRYAGIKRCNILLDNIDNVPGLDDNLKNRYKAEARAIRAFHYFILINNYGDVPLVKQEISIADSKTVPRTAKSEVLQFILDELDFAKNNLPNSYTGSDLGRFTKGAAMALKARVLLCESRWSEVADICNAIITKKEAGNFDLFGNYTGLFQKENKDNIEVMLNVEFMSLDREHRIQYYMIPPTMSGYACLSPSQELVDNYILLTGDSIQKGPYNENTPYASRDPRLDATIIRDGSQMVTNSGAVEIRTALGTGENAINYSSNSTPTGYYVNKFFDKDARSSIYSGFNLILIRYADVLLMYAEAKNELNQFSASEWDLTIKKLRTRAGFTNPAALNFPTDNVNQNALRSIVRKERRSELAMEGLRIMDLRRWKTAEIALNGWLHGMKTDISTIDNGYERVDKRTFVANKHYLWPIPQSERDINKNLTQNPNW